MRKMWKLLVYFIMRTFINRIQYVLYFLIPTTKNQCQCNGIDNKKSIVPSQNAPPINLIIIPFNNFIVCRPLKLHFITQIIKSKYYLSLNNVSIQFTMPQLSVLARFFSVSSNTTKHDTICTVISIIIDASTSQNILTAVCLLCDVFRISLCCERCCLI